MGESSPQEYDAWHSPLIVNVEADDPWYQLIRRHLDGGRDVADRRLIEIGCGRGGFACWLAARSPAPREVVAVDYSRVAVEKGQAYAAANGIARVCWQVGDIQAIDHPDESFDTAVSCETIEHVPNPQQAIRELARVLKPGGRLFLTTPNYFGPMGLYRAYLRIRGRRFTEVGQPINQLTLLPLTLRWIRRSGLVPEAVSGIGHYLPLPGAPPRRLEALDIDALKWLALHVAVVARKPGR